MDVVNHTPFPAQAFEAIDQHEQRFQVFVLRQTLDFSTGQLEYAGKQAPLCDTDTYFGAGFSGGVRQESDYCPYKPRCDVIVNAVAYAPRGEAAAFFFVGLNVVRGGRKVIEKVLRVSGKRYFKKHAIAVRFFQCLAKWGTLFLLRPNPWMLTKPELLTSLPLRAEHAYGGECKIGADDPVARRVPAKYRLTPEQAAAHPDAQISGVKPPAAHAVYESNVQGKGFAPEWYLIASKTTRLAAPQLESPRSPLTARQFWRARGSPSIVPAGFGVRSKLDPERRALLGEIDEGFVNSSAVLPDEFDFGIWNAAQPDQQIDFLNGGDVIELTNLCPVNTPGARANGQSNSSLRLVLPEHECFLLMSSGHGLASARGLLIDTVIVEPEHHQLTLVWRAVIPIDDVAEIKLCEFRMRTFAERDRDRCLAVEVLADVSDVGRSDEAVVL